MVPEFPEEKRFGPERHRAQPELGTWLDPPESPHLYRREPQKPAGAASVKTALVVKKRSPVMRLKKPNGLGNTWSCAIAIAAGMLVTCGQIGATSLL
jgi:hypothetical protein